MAIGPLQLPTDALTGDQKACTPALCWWQVNPSHRWVFGKSLVSKNHPKFLLLWLLSGSKFHPLPGAIQPECSAALPTESQFCLPELTWRCLMPSGVSSDGWKEDQDAWSMDDDSSSALGSWGYLKGSQISSSLAGGWMLAWRTPLFNLRLRGLLGSFAWTFLPVPWVPHPFVFCYCFHCGITYIPL